METNGNPLSTNDSYNDELSQKDLTRPKDGQQFQPLTPSEADIKNPESSEPVSSKPSLPANMTSADIRPPNSVISDIKAGPQVSLRVQASAVSNTIPPAVVTSGKLEQSDEASTGVVSPPLLSPKRQSKKLKKLFIALAVFGVFIAGATVYYLGYYTNPNVIWSQSLSNTAKGYDKLVSYLDSQSGIHYKTLSETGSFKLSSAADYNGNMSFISDGTNGSGSVNVGLGLTNVNVQIRSIKSVTSGTPDIYLQLNGIKGFGDSLGAAFGKQVNSLDGQWIVVDHTFTDGIRNMVGQSKSNAAKPLTRSDMSDVEKSVASVNKEYVFTTNKSKSVTTVVKKYGIETIDGRKTYHYQIGFVKQNVKDYITALRNALSQSKVAPWLQAETGKSIDDTIGYSSLEKSADNIKTSDTIDVWSDMSTRLIYKVRVYGATNRALNYVELGIKYSNGDSFPLFVNVNSKSGSTTNNILLNAVLNVKTNTFTANLSWQESGVTSPLTMTGDFTLKPSSDALNVVAPKGAKPLSTVLDEFGLSSFVNELVKSSVSSAGSVTGAGVAL